MGPCALGPRMLQEEGSSCELTASGGNRTKVDARLRNCVRTLWRH
jgi:hypothetical protein